MACIRVFITAFAATALLALKGSGPALTLPEIGSEQKQLLLLLLHLAFAMKEHGLDVIAAHESARIFPRVSKVRFSAFHIIIQDVR